MNCLYCGAVASVDATHSRPSVLRSSPAAFAASGKAAPPYPIMKASFFIS